MLGWEPGFLPAPFFCFQWFSSTRLPGSCQQWVQPRAQAKPPSMQSEVVGKLHRLKKRKHFIFLTSHEHRTCISLPLGALATAVLQHQALNIYLTSCRIRTNHSYFPSKLHFHLNVIPSVHAQPHPAHCKGSSEAVGCTHSQQRWGICLISSWSTDWETSVPAWLLHGLLPLDSHSWCRDPTSNTIVPGALSHPQGLTNDLIPK